MFIICKSPMDNLWKRQDNFLNNLKVISTHNNVHKYIWMGKKPQNRNQPNDFERQWSESPLFQTLETGWKQAVNYNYLSLLKEEMLDYSISFSSFLCFTSGSATKRFLLQQILSLPAPKGTWHQKKNNTPLKVFMRCNGRPQNARLHFSLLYLNILLFCSPLDVWCTEICKSQFKKEL